MTTTAAQIPVQDTETRPVRMRAADVVILVLSMASAMAYLWNRVHDGWLPEDDGLLGQGALRVLRGQLPHVDFVENYTGGLDYLHAATFRLFGVSAFSMRMALLALSIPFLLAVFYIAFRFVGAKGATVVMLLAAVWSVPTYPTPMPSWYNLYLAVFGAAAIIRFIDNGNKRWLFLAGLFGGLSFDIKVIGLYYVAGVLLFLVFREQELSATPQTNIRGGRFYSAFVIAGLLLFVASVVKLVGGAMREGDAIHFLFPSAALASLLAWRELRSTRCESRSRFAILTSMVLPFLAGFAVPVIVFLAPYIRTGSTHIFAAGVFSRGLAMARDLATVHADLAELGLALPPLVLLFASKCWKGMARTIPAVIVTSALAVALFLACTSSALTESGFYSLSMMTPWVVAIAVVMLAREPRLQKLTSERRQQIMLLVSLAAICSLVQFPFPVAIYFCYFAPLMFLAMMSLVCSGSPKSGHRTVAAVAIFYLLLGVLKIVPGKVYAAGAFESHPAAVRLNLPRGGGIKIGNPQEYESLIGLIQAHARTGKVLATPECPDIYFFSALQNVVNNDGAISPDQLEALLMRDDIYVVVLNEVPTFADQEEPEVTRARYLKRFPFSAESGKYLVMWR